jgi:phosphotransacetylase
MKKRAGALDLDLTKYEIINVDKVEQVYDKLSELMADNRFDLLVKGDIGTRDFVDSFFGSGIGKLSDKSIVTHIELLQTERYHKLMFVTDGGVNANPDAGTLIQIVQNAARVCNKMGIEQPRAALLAAVEAIYPAIPITMTEAAIAKMSDRGQIKGVLIDGPLSFDVAFSAEVARSKGITNSRVAGETDIFAMSTIETAHGVNRAMVMYAGAEAAGILYGGRLPVAAGMTVDPAQNIFNSIILAVLCAVN